MQIVSFAKERKLQKFLKYADEWEVDCYLDAVTKELKVREHFGRRSAEGRKQYRRACFPIKRTGRMLLAMVVLFLAIGLLTAYGGTRLARDVFIIKNVNAVSSLVEGIAMLILFGMTLACICGAYVFLCGGLRYIRLNLMMLKVPKEEESTLIILKDRLQKALRGYTNGKAI